jgi:hypothetical protein
MIDAFAWFAHEQSAIYWVCAFIATVAFICLISFSRDLGKASNAARTLTRNIEAIPPKLPRGSALALPPISRSPISRRFELFQLHLIHHTSANEEIIRTTRPATDFFDAESVLRESLNLRFYQSVPNILVGLGLFFTFFGLTAALTFAAQGATSSNIAQVQDSLKNLLHAASFKFISSLVALALSISFLVFERFALRSYQRTMEALVLALDQAFPVITAEALLNDQGSSEHAQRRANTLLNATSSALESAFDPTFGDGKTQFQLFLQNVGDLLEQNKEQNYVLKEFNTTLAVSISKAIDETLTPSLRGALSTMESTVASLGANLQKANEDVLQRMIDEFAVTLKGQTEDSFSRIISSGNALATALSEQTTKLVESFSLISEVGEKIRSQGAAGIEAIDSSVAGLQHVSTQLLNTADSMEKAGAPLAIAATAVHGILDGLQAVQQASDDSRESLEKIVSSMSSSLKITAQASEETAKAFERQLEVAFNSYRNGFGQIDKDLTLGFAAMSDGIKGAIEQVRTFITASDAGVARAVQGVEGAVSSLEAQLEDLDEWLNKLVPAISEALQPESQRLIGTPDR